MSPKWSQFMAVLWKCYLTTIREQYHLLMQVMAIGFFIFIAFTRLQSKDIKERWNEAKPIPSFSINLIYAPSHSTIEDLMDKAKNKLNISTYRKFESEEDMLENLPHLTATGVETVAIAFDTFGLYKWPKKMKYRIRCAMPLGVTQLFTSKSIFGNDSSSNDPVRLMDKLNYMTSPFLTVQHAINMAYIETRSTQSVSLDIKFQEMPSPSNQDITYSAIYIGLHGPFMLIVLMGMDIAVQEKTSGLKELQKMTGIKVWMLWLGYFIYTTVRCLVHLIIVVCFLKFGFGIIYPVAKYSDIFVVIIFFFFYTLSAIVFGLLSTTLINNPDLTLIPLGWWTFSFYLIPLPKLEPTLRPTAYFHLLIPHSCTSWGLSNIETYEKAGVGLNWSNMWRTANPYAPVPTMGLVIIAFVFQSICMLILLWYLDQVLPGAYGVSRRWNFPFKKSYWKSNKVENDNINFESVKSRPEVEEVPKEMTATAGIRVRNLYKNFKDRTVVKNMNIDVYNDEITMLLGHNGAGKTVTMNIITGMIKATSGTVLINGYNIETSDKARASLGYCTQHNLNFELMTVFENVTYFSMIKGYSKKQASRQAWRSLSLLALETKAKFRANQLSGGMQRRMSLAIALAGDSRVLVLDEPTSGLDPETRREIWDIILRLREKHCILMSTHYLDEADILGDRIAIMHHGQLFCYGTSLFLKKLYGTGYLITVMLEPSTDVNPITESIQSVIPAATIDKTLDNCVNYKLPTTDTAVMAKLFTQLENKKLRGVKNIGVTFNNLEDVFLKVQRVGGAGDNIQTMTIPQRNRHVSNHYEDEYNDEKLSGPKLLCQQFEALTKKHWQYMKHNVLILTGLIAVPVTAIIWIIYIFLHVDKVDDQFELNLDPYGLVEVLYSNTSKHADLAKCLETTVRDQQAYTNNVPQVSTAIMNIAKKNMDRYLRSLIVAFELNETVANVMYGPMAVHGPAIGLHVLSNALLRLHMRNDTYQLLLTNHPIVSSIDALEFNHFGSYLLYVPMITSIASALLLKLPHSERETGFRHLQMLAGASRPIYWLSTLVVHIIVLNIIYLFYIALLICIIGKCLLTASAIAMLILVYFSTGLAWLSVVYFCHFRQKFSDVISVVLIIDMFGVGLCVFQYTALSRPIIIYVDYLLPPYTMLSGVMNIILKSFRIYEWDRVGEQQQQYICALNATFNPCCDQDSAECSNLHSYFSGQYNILYHIIFSILSFILYFLLFLYFDSGVIEKWRTKHIYKRNENNLEDTEILDNDVVEEKDRINHVVKERKNRRRSSIDPQQTTAISDLLVVHNLRKVFKSFYAVRGVNFGVMPGECFGLLGINGAGKTTTFKMISGEISPSTGSTDILGYTLDKHKNDYYRNLGYSPQFDALNFSLTTRETLELFAKLRGVVRRNREGQVRKWIKTLGLKEYENMPCGLYSGGNKRKLCVGIALSGNPSLLMLDEPTSAVDVDSAHKIWAVLQLAKANGQSIVLTSHKMEECEKLCERLAIMMDGQLRCIGSVPYLKRKFDQGYTIMIKLQAESESDEKRETNLKNVKRQFEDYFKAKLTEEHGDILSYQVNTENQTPGKIFRFMETLKRKLEGFINDYTVCEPSLEQVFLSFAKEKMRFTKNLYDDESENQNLFF